MTKLAIIAGVLALTVGAATAHAFCGFYVSGSGSKMSNDATQVVLMRQGTRTVLTMQNDYKGPLEDFAMVVPVPVVLQKADVKTLAKDLFARVESMGSPRLVEYWEQDPCPVPIDEGHMYGSLYGASGGSVGFGRGYGTIGIRGSVKVEAKFSVGEYDILILSATEAAGLETWLGENHYKIPDGAEPLLRPYVEAGSKFFVAKVDPKKVEMVEGRAALSPLRFHYDSEDFSLPIRLGLASSSGKQDLIINIISPDTRYEVANYKNVFIPTNVDVAASVKARFSEFYAALFDKTLAANPRAVVTEYAWTVTRAQKCDPCPDLQMTDADVAQLGADVLKESMPSYVMTRLHARYGAKDMKDDLRFKVAKPVGGGRELYGSKGIEYGAVDSKENFFQARYSVRHWWTGAIKCENPTRRVWGGPPNGGSSRTIAANKLAFAPRGKLQLASVIKRDLWEIGFKRAKPAPATKPAKQGPVTPAKAIGVGSLGLLFVALGLRRRENRRA
ncbi:MAG TPA: DUF2330 domain-containing protein [Kofleriaceae bacterium]